MASVLGSIGAVFQNIFSLFAGMGGYFPPGTWIVLLVMLVVGIICS